MIAALTHLGPDRGLFRGWSVYWFYLTFGYHLVGDHRRELREAREGRRRHPADFAVLAAEVRALAALGRAAEDQRAVDRCAESPATAGLVPRRRRPDRGARAGGARSPADAPAAGAWAVRWLEGRPPAEVSSVANRFRLALAYYVNGRVDDARRMLEVLASERAAACRTTPLCGGSRSSRRLARSGDHPGFSGSASGAQERRADAMGFERTLQAMSPRYLYGRHTMWRARIHAVLGDPDAAVALGKRRLPRGIHAAG